MGFLLLTILNYNKVINDQEGFFGFRFCVFFLNELMKRFTDLVQE